MASREELQISLKAIEGINAAYFVPDDPQNMKYPCIVYDLDDIDTKFASDTIYRMKRKYKLTIISADKDHLLAEAVITKYNASWVTSFTSNNLYHQILDIYF